jgi:hypothetical protein
VELTFGQRWRRRPVQHQYVVESLKRPRAYSHPVGSVEVIQTHISVVFLTGGRVYKLKKPVNFGFLDFSTLELREHYCRREVELNRRLAPWVYLGVEPVTVRDGRAVVGGEGDPVEWVVVMEQLDQERLGTRLEERGELGSGHLDQLVEQLVPFYEHAATGEGVDQYGTVEAVRFNTDENFSQTEAYVGKLLSRPRYEEIRDFTNSFFEEHVDLFARRIAEGRVRESHGDLHLGNIFFLDEPVVFDCIEFNPRLACGDVAVDLAFLKMDLDFHDRPELADYFVERYVAASGDAELTKLMDFYSAYRAYVRGKIAAFTQSDPSLDKPEQRRQRNLARRYFGLAHRYSGGQSKPIVVVLYGLMGTGKTWIGRYLRETRRWNLVSTDAVRKQMAGVGEDTRVYVPYNEGLYSPEMNQRTYDEVAQRAENMLMAGFPVVVDGAYKSVEDRQPLLDAAERAGAKVLFLQTVCSEEEQHRRLTDRQRHDTRSDGRVELMEQQRHDFEPPPEGDPRFARVDTSGAVEHTRERVDALLDRNGFDEPGCAQT